MDLWEFNNCVVAYNETKSDAAKEQLSIAWQTANFVGAAFAGKLRKLNYYMGQVSGSSAPRVSKEDFEQKLKQAKGASSHGNRKTIR